MLLSTFVSFYFVPPMFRLVMGARQGGTAMQERALSDLRQPSEALALQRTLP